MSLDAKMKKILQTAEKALGPRRKGLKLPPLETAIFHILLPYNAPDQVQKAMDALKKEFVDWNEVRVSSWKEIGNILDRHHIREPGDKAFALRKALTEVFNRYNKISLDALLAAKPEEARSVFGAMREFPDVGAGAVLALNLDYPGLHVSRSLLRIAKRLGIVRDATLSKGKHEIERRFPGKDAFRAQQHLAHLASTVCLEEITICERCPLEKLCETAEEKARSKAAREKKASARKAAAKKAAAKKASAKKASAKKAAAKKAAGKKPAAKKPAPARTAAKPPSGKGSATKPAKAPPSPGPPRKKK